MAVESGRDDMASVSEKDYHVRLTPEGEAFISAEVTVTGRTASEVIREVVQAAAELQIRKSSLMRGFLNGEGNGGRRRE
jgi:hypothetical protein